MEKPFAGMRPSHACICGGTGVAHSAEPLKVLKEETESVSSMLTVGQSARPALWNTRRTAPVVMFPFHFSKSSTVVSSPPFHTHLRMASSAPSHRRVF